MANHRASITDLGRCRYGCFADVHVTGIDRGEG